MGLAGHLDTGVDWDGGIDYEGRGGSEGRGRSNKGEEGFSTGEAKEDRCTTEREGSRQGKEKVRQNNLYLSSANLIHRTQGEHEDNLPPAKKAVPERPKPKPLARE